MDSYRILIGICSQGRFFRYEQAVKKAGFYPVFVTEAYDVLNRRLQGRLLRCVYADRRFCDACAEQYDGLLLPGGGDLPSVYSGQMEYCGSGMEAQVDRMQFYLAESFLSAGKPVMGICKGMQLLNILFGGTLYPDLPDGKREHHAYDAAHGKDREHDSLIDPLFLSRMNLRRNLRVNSAHHQAVECPGDRLQVIQQADDGVIEGICHHDFPAVGFQWHPERLSTPESDLLFRESWAAMFRGERLLDI
ncbi:MAG: gamma-glutamyl-gamma-aminobutyrate hydrolase family protein [Lachnospiraceae bacterium]